jgi:hypothetical protein
MEETCKISPRDNSFGDAMWDVFREFAAESGDRQLLRRLETQDYTHGSIPPASMFEALDRACGRDMFPEVAHKAERLQASRDKIADWNNLRRFSREVLRFLFGPFYRRRVKDGA